jgi:hypothetical protein
MVMQTIWKEVLKPSAVQEVMLPAGAEILCACDQHEQICIWFKCDPAAPKESRTIAICGTGHPAPDGDGRYLGTGFLHGGSFVFHVFEHQAVRPASGGE